MTSEEEEMRKYTYVMTGMKTWELLVIMGKPSVVTKQM